MKSLRLGTRGSALALTQTRWVAARLRKAHADLEIEEVVIETHGDRHGLFPIGAAEDRGVFVREIEEALRDGRVDLAVHSMKDLPTVEPPGLVIAAVPERHDARDALLTLEGQDLQSLAPGAVLATGSPRRRSQILHARPDLATTPVRGNVDTRVRKLTEGRFDALVLALAGVERLGITSIAVRPIPISVCLPAVGQGALALETRADDSAARRLVGALADVDATTAVLAERAFLRRLGGGCLAPAAAYAEVEAGRITIQAVVADLDGRRLLREREEGEARQGEILAEAMAARLLERGAGEMLAAIRGAAGGGEPV